MSVQSFALSMKFKESGLWEGKVTHAARERIPFDSASPLTVPSLPHRFLALLLHFKESTEESQQLVLLLKVCRRQGVWSKGWKTGGGVITSYRDRRILGEGFVTSRSRMSRTSSAAFFSGQKPWDHRTGGSLETWQLIAASRLVFTLKHRALLNKHLQRRKALLKRSQKERCCSSLNIESLCPCLSLRHVFSASFVTSSSGFILLFSKGPATQQPKGIYRKVYTL